MTEKELLNAIVKARKSQKITQKAVAQKIGVNVVSLSGFERGRVHISLSRILQICEALGLSLTVQKLDLPQERCAWQEFFLEMTKDLPPTDLELLFEIAQIMRDRHNLRS